MKNNPHILIIRLSALGDVAMLVPLLRVFEKTYPNVKITLLSKPFHEPMFKEFKNVQFFSASVKDKHKGIVGLYKLYKELKQQNITHVADVHNVIRSKILGLFFRSSGVKVQQIDKGRAEKKALTRAKNKVFMPLKTTLQRYSEVFESLGFALDLNQHEFPKAPPPSKKIAALLTPSENQKKIGIAPFAAHSGKMYPLDLMEQVVSKIEANKNAQVYLFGGGEIEKNILSQWESKYKIATHLVGKISFAEELAFISQLDVMVAMDSGNAHLAAMYNVPTITLWGVTHPYAGFYPFNQSSENALLACRKQYPLIPTSIYGNTFPAGYENVMTSITPQQVVDKIEQVLKPELCIKKSITC